jgi:hypothetical protein
MKEILEIERVAKIETSQRGRVEATLPVLVLGRHVCLTGSGRTRKEAIRAALKAIAKIGSWRWARTQPLL